MYLRLVSNQLQYNLNPEGMEEWRWLESRQLTLAKLFKDLLTLYMNLK